MLSSVFSGIAAERAVVVVEEDAEAMVIGASWVVPGSFLSWGLLWYQLIAQILNGDASVVVDFRAWMAGVVVHGWFVVVAIWG